MYAQCSWLVFVRELVFAPHIDIVVAVVCHYVAHTKLWTFGLYYDWGQHTAPAAVSINFRTRKIYVEIARVSRRGPEHTHTPSLSLNCAASCVVSTATYLYNMVTCQINPYDLIYYEFAIFCTSKEPKLSTQSTLSYRTSMSSSSPSPSAVEVGMHVDCYYIL